MIDDSRSVTLAAPAKVNLFLHVIGRRDDGYHRIESLFALIDLADTVTLAPTADGTVVRANDVDGVPERDDLAVRAALLLQEATGTRTGVSIRLDKRIPMGAGLGGGSSDAASVLLGLNRLWKLDRSRADLAALGERLGADVPFFVHGQHAFVRGIGEIVDPVTMPRYWLALAMPAVNVTTAAIYASPALTRCTASAKIIVFSESYGRNDLAPVAATRHPEVARALASLGRIVPDARMTGSGAAVIAAFRNEAAARSAVEALQPTIAARVVATLSRHPLSGFAR